MKTGSVQEDLNVLREMFLRVVQEEHRVEVKKDKIVPSRSRIFQGQAIFLQQGDVNW